MKRKLYCWLLRKPIDVKTKGDLLQAALKKYLEEWDVGVGLCWAIRTSLRDYDYTPYHYEDLVNIFPLFNRSEAVNYGGSTDSQYWWPLEDWQSRYRFMKKLIKQYKHEPLDIPKIGPGWRVPLPWQSV